MGKESDDYLNSFNADSSIFENALSSGCSTVSGLGLVASIVPFFSTLEMKYKIIISGITFFIFLLILFSRIIALNKKYIKEIKKLVEEKRQWNETHKSLVVIIEKNKRKNAAHKRAFTTLDNSINNILLSLEDKSLQNQIIHFQKTTHIALHKELFEYKED